jgi:hypothetical protein
MRKWKFFIVLILIINHYSFALLPIRLYVSKQGQNTTGTTWEDAFTSISAALSQVNPPNSYDIWVAEGIY